MGEKKTKQEIQRDYEKRSGYAAAKKYDKEHTKYIGLKLNKNTDQDILNALEGKAAQTEVKRLLRIGIANDTQ